MNTQNSARRILTLILVLLIGAGINSCTRNFEDINLNPNAPTEVQPSLLLRQVIYSYGEGMSYEGYVAGNLLGQYFTEVDFNLFDRHSLTEPQYGGNPWPILYTNLRDNELILKSAQENQVYAVYEGPARILKAYMTAALTDIYGDVPYSEALQGQQGNVTPAYDAQEDIYTSAYGILDNLDLGIGALLNYSGAQKLEGDILFNGDLAAWITFANSLKIKYLMRISGVKNVSAELQSIYDSGDYLNSNSQNATYDFTDGQPNNFRMATLRAGDFNLFVMSKTMEEILKMNNDPRMAVMYRPIGNDSTGTVYAGLLNGQDASQTSITVADYSLGGTIFRDHTGDLDANFLTAWETHFLLAEAAARGYINGNAQTHYETGVQLAFDYWHTALPATYLTTDSAAYGSFGQDPIQQIITQKWIANTINGYEGWIEYRRTGFPVLKPVAASLNNGLIPVRMPYPTDEDVLNNINFLSATSINGNSVNSRVWWDVN
ncbi:MAG: SusD/RagB family nutrient-binding outer membrane lipoprotein [Bacteroidia bacterium]|nr:SusD/RagB family nutrient-binding outer membrane lipoprotein [Bacteroidia bacterium]